MHERHAHTWDLTFRRVHHHVRNVFRDRQVKNLVAHNRTVLGAISHKLYFITRGGGGDRWGRENKRATDDERRYVSITPIAVSSGRAREQRGIGVARKS